MSQLKLCQGPSCHTYRTKDRIRGSKGDKHYETRKRSSFYYLDGNACSMTCERDWFNKFGKMALDHFGRLHEPKRVGCDSAWYKSSDWNSNSRSYDQYYFINDLLGERRPITQEQYNNKELTQPS
jgi:hypothetical protein